MGSSGINAVHGVQDLYYLSSGIKKETEAPPQVTIQMRMHACLHGSGNEIKRKHTRVPEGKVLYAKHTPSLHNFSPSFIIATHFMPGIKIPLPFLSYPFVSYQVK